VIPVELKAPPAVDSQSEAHERFGLAELDTAWTCSPSKVSTKYPPGWIDLLVEDRGYFVALEVSSLMFTGRLAASRITPQFSDIMPSRVAALTIIVAPIKSETKVK
jgi:hypothetical protein